MTFAIGDIHGEYSKLKLLIKNILSFDDNAQFIFIGDYIDKGENSWQTLKYLTQLSNEKECIFLRGNHEYYWELLKENNDKYAEYLIRYGALNTVSSIREKLSISEAKKALLLEFKFFFYSLRNYSVINNYVITHSGIPPELFSVSIENIDPEQFLFNRYGFISSSEHYFGKRIIFGHTGFYSPYYDGYKIGIDTAACYLRSQPLTAFCLDEEVFINSNNEFIQLASMDRSCCPVIPRIKAWRQIN
jgi:serine/threonine protein phosphatase 1